MERTTGRLVDQHDRAICLLTQADSKTNERKAALAMLKSLVLNGKVIGGNAAIHQRDAKRRQLPSKNFTDERSYPFGGEQSANEQQAAIAELRVCGSCAQRPMQR